MKGIRNGPVVKAFEEQNTYVVFDAKDWRTVTSAVWRRDYKPDLCFVSKDGNDRPLTASK